jgi:hypothetical protein
VGMDVVWGVLCRENCHTLGTRQGLALMCVGYQAVSKHGVVGKGFGWVLLVWCVVDVLYGVCSAHAVRASMGSIVQVVCLSDDAVGLFSTCRMWLEASKGRGENVYVASLWLTCL